MLVRKRSTIVTCTLVLLFLHSFTCLESQNELRFKKINVNEGLNSSSVGYVFQDSRGYIWLSTGDGLTRYDGYEFKVYRHNPRDPHSLGGTSTGAIKEDADHNLWMTMSDGACRFDPRTEQFTNYHANAQDSHAIIKSNVYVFLELDKYKRVWVGCEDGLNLLDPATGKVRRFRSSGKDEHSLPHSNIHGLAIYKDQTLWVSTAAGICSIDLTSLAIKRFPLLPKKSRAYSISENDVLLIGDTSAYRINSKGEPYLLRITNIDPKRRNLSYTYSNSMPRDGNGHYWVAGMQVSMTDSTLTFVDKVERKMWPYGAWGIAYDFSGSIFAGGEGIELYMANLYNSKFINVALPNPVFPDHHNPAWSLAEENDTSLWVSCQSSVFNVNIHSGRVTLIAQDPKRKDWYEGYGSFSNLRDSKGNIWIENGILNKYIPGSGKFVKYRSVKGDSTSHPRSALSALYETSNGHLWMNLWGPGILEFDPVGEKFKWIRSSNKIADRLPRETIRSLFEDKDHQLWVGGSWNLSQMDLSSYKVKKNLLPDELKGEISAITQTKEGELWLGHGSKGLLKFDIKTGKVLRQYTRYDGLSHDNIAAIVNTADGHLWISTNTGICDFDIQSEKFTKYDYSDGLINNEFNGQSATLGKTGWVYFGTNAGISAFHPDRMGINPIPPKIHITGISLFNEKIGILPSDQRSEGGPCRIRYENNMPMLDRHISFVEDLELAYDENFLTLEFVALHYCIPSKNRYMYKMEGLEKQWNDVGTRRFASYTALQPGEYVFRVRACNSDGIWQEEGASVRIRVTPPFWKTTWFRLVAISALAFMLYLLYRWRTASLRKRKEELERTVEERTAEVVSQKNTIEMQKELVEEKQKEIIDSITYAKRLQQALLPPLEFVKQELPESFILYRPKDIVAGDFYWMETCVDLTAAEQAHTGKAEDKCLLVAAADCTGHGVPGAMMSVVCCTRSTER